MYLILSDGQRVGGNGVWEALNSSARLKALFKWCREAYEACHVKYGGFSISKFEGPKKISLNFYINKYYLYLRNLLSKKRESISLKVSPTCHLRFTFLHRPFSWQITPGMYRSSQHTCPDSCPVACQMIVAQLPPVKSSSTGKFILTTLFPSVYLNTHCHCNFLLGKILRLVPTTIHCKKFLL